MSTKQFIADANYVLRWFLGDIPERASTVERLLTHSADGSIELDRISVAEITYVLRSKGYDHQQVVTVVQEFYRYASLVSPTQTDSLALDLYAATTLDFEDCWLVARAHNTSVQPATFDKQLLKLATSLQ